ncbi:MAG: hypothetical protein IPK69_13205 [Phycisphaerales bacterium]|nr:MAG: hypothetical protein IPK69_13205 [Phycisphaerales bacterium]
MPTPREIPVALWLDPSQATLAAALVEHTNTILARDHAALNIALRVTHLGTPPAPRAATPIADLFHSTKRFDDLRAGLAEFTSALEPSSTPSSSPATPSGLVLLLSTDSLHTPATRPAFDLISARDCLCVSTFPIPGTLMQPIPPSPPRVLGMPHATSTARALLDALADEHLGHIRSLSLTIHAPPTHAPAGALLFAALDLLRAILGEPEETIAFHTPPSPTTHSTTSSNSARAPLHLASGDSLLTLHGDATLLARTPHGATATIHASNMAQTHDWHATILTTTSEVHLTPRSLHIRPGDDAPPSPADADNHPSTSTTLLAESLARMLDTSRPSESPDLANVLPITQAALLSMRTGHAESPERVRRLLSKP